MRKTFKYRCYPNKGTRRRLYKAMRVYGDIWSNACAERSRAYFKWRDTVYAMRTAQEAELGRELKAKELAKIRKEASQKLGCAVSQYDQYHLIRKRDHPEYEGYYAKSLERVLAGVDAAFKSFYALAKTDPEAAPPNQKRFHNCISYRCSGWNIDGNNLYLSKLGKFRLRLHRPIEGKIKVVSITQKNGRWYASFSCESENFSGACGPVSATKSCILQDLQQEHIPPGGTDHDKAESVELKFAFTDGLFVQDSVGVKIPHPEFYFTHIGELRRLSRALSRKQFRCAACGEFYKSKPRRRKNEEPPTCRNCGVLLRLHATANRIKARHTLAMFHEHIRNKRDYFLWAVARLYAANYKIVTVPKWPLDKKIQYAVTSETARKLCDSAYGRFVEMLRHKCRELGTELIERKDVQWQEEMQKANQVQELEQLQVVLRKCRKALKYLDPRLLP
jgi:transposase